MSLRRLAITLWTPRKCDPVWGEQYSIRIVSKDRSRMHELLLNYQIFILHLKSYNYSNNVMYCTESMPAKGTEREVAIYFSYQAGGSKQTPTLPSSVGDVSPSLTPRPPEPASVSESLQSVCMDEPANAPCELSFCRLIPAIDYHISSSIS